MGVGSSDGGGCVLQLLRHLVTLGRDLGSKAGMDGMSAGNEGPIDARGADPC